MKEIQSRLCLLPTLFTEQFVFIVLSKYFIGFCLAMLGQGGYSVQERREIKFISIMFFSKKPGEKKQEKYESDIGRLFSKFRHGVMPSAFLDIQNNALITFASQTVQSAMDAGEGIEPGKPGSNPVVADKSTTGIDISTLRQALWLKPGFVRADNSEAAGGKSEKRVHSESLQSLQTKENELADVSESSQSSLKIKMSKNSPITHYEVAIEAANMVYKGITNLLYKAFKTKKVQLFHEFMYLFTGWSQFNTTVDQKNLKPR